VSPKQLGVAAVVILLVVGVAVAFLAGGSDESASASNVRPAAAERATWRDVLGAQAIERDAYRAGLQAKGLTDDVKAER